MDIRVVKKIFGTIKMLEPTYKIQLVGNVEASNNHYIDLEFQTCERLPDIITCLSILMRCINILMDENESEPSLKNVRKVINIENYSHVPGYDELIKPQLSELEKDRFLFESWNLHWVDDYDCKHEVVVNMNQSEKDYITLMANISLNEFKGFGYGL